MTFADIPAGTAVFVDSNVLLYHFTQFAPFGVPSQGLLERAESGDIRGFTSANALSEVAHRLKGVEAVARFGWPHQGIARRMKRRPTEVQQLGQYRRAIDELSLLGVEVLDVTGRLVSLATDVSRQHGLLSGDALIVAVMREHGLTAIASNDADFDRVPGLKRYAPA